MTPQMHDRIAEIAEGLRDRVRDETGAVFVAKGESAVHRGIAAALDLADSVRDIATTFGVDIPLAAPSGSRYLRDFATTLGHVVAMPASWGPLDQLLVDAHEGQHVVQHRAGVDAGWWPRVTSHSVLYLAGVLAHTAAGEEYVGKVEGDAYAVTETVRAWLAGAPLPLEQTLRPLVESYNLLGVGSEMAALVLRSHYATLSLIHI